MRNQDKYNTENVKEILSLSNLTMLGQYKDAKSKILCIDSEGYYVYVILSNYLSRGSVGARFDTSNDYTIYNINHYLNLNNVHFVCISEKFISANDDLLFKCLLCDEIVNAKWRNINKNDNSNRNHIICPNCDGKTESIHALVLKQMFIYYYPDTIVEDKSFVSPITNKICPTDIVNHKLKIAIEIQSQWHDYSNIIEKDKRKKQFWIDKGYKFYDPDIRNYSVLEMCQLFFNIVDIPKWVNYEYSNKLNIKKIQVMLNNNLTITEIANELNIDKHRIYDAIYNKKLFYPLNYKYKNIVKKEYISQESPETAGCA